MSLRFGNGYDKIKDALKVDGFVFVWRPLFLLCGIASVRLSLIVMFFQCLWWSTLHGLDCECSFLKNNKMKDSERTCMCFSPCSLYGCPCRFPGRSVLKAHDFRKYLKSKLLLLFGEKSSAMNLLATHCLYTLEMAMTKQKYTERKKRGSFCWWRPFICLCGVVSLQLSLEMQLEESECRVFLYW